MSEEIQVDQQLTKKQKYEQLLPQIKALVAGERDITANLANICAALKTTFNWWWVGFYLVKENELVVGPFQGPVACSRIAFGKGVCGSAWQQKDCIVVADVEKFEGHIACSSATKSEIVIPVMVGNEVFAVLDADSEHLSYFDHDDKTHLLELTKFIATRL